MYVCVSVSVSLFEPWMIQFMALAINTIDGCGPSYEVRDQLLTFYWLYTTNMTKC